MNLAPLVSFYFALSKSQYYLIALAASATSPVLIYGFTQSVSVAHGMGGSDNISNSSFF
jgi:hypothetical protein